MGGGKQQKARDNTQDRKSSSMNKITDGTAVNAVVEEFLGRTGGRGEVIQVKVKILSGKNEGRSMRRNAKGPLKIGDLLTLRETEIEARKLKGSTGRSI
jgi:small subunit ribosomal protein S28e